MGLAHEGPIQRTKTQIRVCARRVPEEMLENRFRKKLGQ